MSEFTPYAQRQPEKEGPYRWRMPSLMIKGLTVEFVACMRRRWAGHREVISPSFDHWNGARLIVPPGTEWTDTDVECHPHRYVALSLDIELLPCPFCRQVPTWKGINRGNGGILVGAHPGEYNSWWLECCQWVTTPHMKDPRELAALRNAAIRGPA